MNPRSDQQLIRFIEQKQGKETAEAIQNLPYIEIDQQTGDERIWPAVKFSQYDIGSPEAIAGGEELERFTSYALKNLPWEAFVLRSPAFELISQERETENDQYESVRTGKFFHFFVVFTGQDFIAKEVQTSKGPRYNVFTKEASLYVVDRETNALGGTQFHYYPENGKTWMPDTDMPFMKAILTVCDVHAVYCLAYLAMCPERLIETKSTEKPNRQMRKAAAKDISQRVDLATHILLDPLKAPAYQPEQLRSIVASGISRSPHRRRSHWRRLPDKVVRVRESWIGPKDWEYKGRSYKVIQAKSNTDND